MTTAIYQAGGDNEPRETETTVGRIIKDDLNVCWIDKEKYKRGWDMYVLYVCLMHWVKRLAAYPELSCIHASQ
jgi:hypothetical protein